MPLPRLPLPLRVYARVVSLLGWLLTRVGAALLNHERRLPLLWMRLRGWLAAAGLGATLTGREPRLTPAPRPAWNRTPPQIEEQVVRLHIEQPRLGAGQLRDLVERVAGVRLARETIRDILMRNRDLIRAMEDARGKMPRRITVSGPRELWGMDLSLVFVLGFFPVWVFGVVDYHGSRLMALEPLLVPTSAQVARVLERAIEEHGAPERALTDNGGVFLGDPVQEVFARHEIEHTRTKPCHPWTAGRIERIWLTMKTALADYAGIITSFAHLARLCSDVMTWYNRDRPHSAWGGRTPDEVYFGREAPARPLGRVDYFDGGLHWYRLG